MSRGREREGRGSKGKQKRGGEQRKGGKKEGGKEKGCKGEDNQWRKGKEKKIRKVSAKHNSECSRVDLTCWCLLGLRGWGGGREKREKEEEMVNVDSNTHIPFVPFCKQSMPRAVFSSVTCCDLTSARVLIGLSPEFSASAIGMDSRASANARIAYCSIVEIYGMEWEDEISLQLTPMCVTFIKS